MQIPRKMSAQNVMASISRTLGTRHASASNESKGPAAGSEVKFAGEESKDKLYEPKHKQKLVRVLTVVAYIISVSLAAIVLSLYYMYIWDPTDDAYNTAKQRANGTNATAAASTVRTLCSEIGQAVALEPMDRLNGTSLDRTTPLVATTESSRSSERPSPGQPTRSLYKTLTSPASRRNDFELAGQGGATEQPGQFLPAARRANAEDYSDAGTIAPLDESLDD